MIATLIFTAAVAQQQTISFTHPCANSAVVLEALGKQLGVTMRPSGSVTKDYFLVSFHDVPEQEALQEIAETLDATWEIEGNVTYLTRTSAMDKKEREDRNAYDLAAYSKLLDSDATRIEPDYGIEQARDLISRDQALLQQERVDFTKRQEVQQGDPAYRLAKSFVRGFGAARLQKLERNRTYYYSDYPEKDELPIPKDLTPLVDRFYREDAVHIEAVNQFAPTSHRTTQGLYANVLPVKVRVSIHWSDYSVFVMVETQGTEYRAYTQIAWLDLDPPRPKIDVSVPDGATFKVSDLGREILERRSLDNLTQYVEPQRPVSAELAAALRDMPNFEPLDALYSNALLSLAEAKNKGIVAVLPDSVLGRADWLQDGSTQPIASVLRFLGRGDAEGSETDHWITIAPAIRDTARATRFSRDSVSVFLKSFDRTGRVTVDNLAAFACANLIHNDYINGSAMWIAQRFTALGTSAQQPDVSQGNMQALVVYDSLNQLAKNRAKAGWVEGPASSLSKLTSARLKNLFLINPRGFSKPFHEKDDWDQTYLGANQPGVVDTRAFDKTGLPPDARVAIRVVDDTTLEPMQANMDVWTSFPRDIDQLAMFYRFAMEMPSGHEVLDYGRMYVVPTMRLDVRVTLANGTSVTYKVIVPSRKYGDKAYAPDQLPEPMKTRFAQALEKAKKSHISRGPLNGGG